jgi:Ca-activated chloride channel family protein
MFPVTFDVPLLLWGLLLVPAAVTAYVLAQRRRARYAVRFTNLDVLAGVAPRTPGWRRHVPPALYTLALAALLASLARPQALVPVPKEQATVVMVMDTSGSMAATDVRPSRTAAAQQAAGAFLGQLPAPFRVAVVSFASTARTLAPPTTDRATVRQALSVLRADGGTAMGDGITRALELIQSAQAGGAAPTPAPTATAPQPAPAATPDAGGAPAAILLLSDGANTAGAVQPLAAAERARQLGVPVYAIALGTPEGTLQTGGRPQPVPPDPETLTRIAALTGGQFFAAPTAADLQAVYRDIGSRIGFEYELQEITVAFAAAGAALLALGTGAALRWSSRFP